MAPCTAIKSSTQPRSVVDVGAAVEVGVGFVIVKVVCGTWLTVVAVAIVNNGTSSTFLKFESDARVKYGEMEIHSNSASQSRARCDD